MLLIIMMKWMISTIIILILNKEYEASMKRRYSIMKTVLIIINDD